MSTPHRHNGGRSASTPPESSHSLNRSPLWERNDRNGRNSRRERNRRRRPAGYDFAEDEEGSLIQFDRLFYDLWFVANLTVFATVHPITEVDALVSFVGYFLLLWNTWFITTTFDARFIHDGILPRLARACHLTVMIGFAIAGAAFDRKELIRSIIKALSLFLVLSRLVLTAQYCLVLYGVRHNKRGRRALVIAATLTFVPAIAYLIVGIISDTSNNRHVIIVWYVVGLLELLGGILHATLSKTLSFEGTHFNERLNLLTLIVLGEAKNAAKIVEYTYLKGISTYWCKFSELLYLNNGNSDFIPAPALVGTLFSAGAIIYITYQLYFDWMPHEHHHPHMTPWRHAAWTLIHLPFHAVLVLLSEGSSQWAVWWRAIESYGEVEAKLEASVNDNIANGGSTRSSKVAEALKDTAYSIMKKYGSDPEDGSNNSQDLDAAFDDIKGLPSSFWDRGMKNSSDPNYRTWVDSYLGVSRTTMNSVSKAFGLSSEDKKDSSTTDWKSAELAAVNSTSVRLHTIFAYLFVSAGIVLMLLMILHILAKRRGWSQFDLLRAAIVFTTGTGLSLVATIKLNPSMLSSFINSPLQLPIILICYFGCLVLTHIPISSPPANESSDQSEKGVRNVKRGHSRTQDPESAVSGGRQRHSISREEPTSGYSRQRGNDNGASDTDRSAQRKGRSEPDMTERIIDHVWRAVYEIFVPRAERQYDRRGRSRAPAYWV
ncbi:unnamed protein product [Clonostachys byssicola]|uniref:Low temperature requirement A n=1 Tax=Clonostachys byssicola TaxID=160290 RepID=A0A9N9XUH8_9HYPO|nr:unnamed protein product [Clonostachys byssicola]